MLAERCQGKVSPTLQCARPSGHYGTCNGTWCKADDHTVPTDGEPIDRITHALVCAYGTEHPTVALCKTLATGIDDRREHGRIPRARVDHHVRAHRVRWLVEA